LGEDDQMRERVNPYWFTGREEERWAAWIAEDRAALAGDGQQSSDSGLVHARTATRTVMVSAR
jgi:hypothetical protein